MTTIPKIIKDNPNILFFWKGTFFIFIKPKLSIISDERVWPRRPRDIVKDAPIALKLKLLNKTVKTPITPALYKNIGMFLEMLSLYFFIISTKSKILNPTI